MNKLRKTGSVLTASVLAATVSVAGMGAASAASYTIDSQMSGGHQYIGDWGLAVADEESLSESATFRSIPLASYATIEVEDDVIVGATWTANNGPLSAAVQAAGNAGMSGASQVTDMLEIIEWLEEDDANAEAFALAAADVTGFASLGVQMAFDSASGVWKSTQTNSAAGGVNTAIAGLHLVYSPDGDFTPFLVATKAVANGTTYYPEGQAEGVYATIKNLDEEGGVTPGPDGEDQNNTADLNVVLQYNDGVVVEGIQLAANKAYDSTNGMFEGLTATTDANGAATFSSLFYYTGNDPQTVTFHIAFTDPEGGSRNPQLTATTGLDANGQLEVTNVTGNNQVTSAWDNDSKVLTLTLPFESGTGGGTTTGGLPVTGAAGIGALVVVALLALGGGLALRRKKYQTEEA